MVTRQTAIKTVKEFVKEVQAQGVHLKKAWLFGSVAQNRQREDSDIDVALVSDDFTGIGFRDIPLFVKALRNYYTIQPKTFSTHDFQNTNAFVEEIMRTGIEIPV